MEISSKTPKLKILRGMIKKVDSKPITSNNLLTSKEVLNVV